MRQNEPGTAVLDASEIKEAEGFLRHLSAATRNLLFYPPGHAVLKRSIEAVHNSAVSLLGDRPELSIGLLGEEWIVHNTVLHKATSVAMDLRERLTDRGLTSITIARGLSQKDLEALANLLTNDPDTVNERGASAILREFGAAAVHVGHITRATDTEEVKDVPEASHKQDNRSTAEFLRLSTTTIASLYSEALEGTMDLRIAKSMLTDMMDLAGSGQANLSTMLNIKSHDDYTFTHIVNVCVLTLAQARRLNLKEELLDEIGLAALMHDVGKQRVPGEIIRKPSRLTTEEFEIMKKHTIYGAEMLRSMPGALDLASMVAFEHHLKNDCTGYPKIASRRGLNLCTHLTMIADAFDAMRTLRPYSKEMSQEEVAIRMTADAGTHFEPVLLGRLFQMLDLFPCGSKVSLSTGEEAVVVRRTPHNHMKPVVKITKDSHGEQLGDGRLIDLMKADAPSTIHIVGAPDLEEAPGSRRETGDGNGDAEI